MAHSTPPQAYNFHVLRENAAYVGARWVQGDDSIQIKRIDGGVATIQITTISTGQTQNEQAFLVPDPDTGGGSFQLGDGTSICNTVGTIKACSPMVLPGTLSITNAVGMIALTGTGAGTITNASAAGLTIGCSTTGADCVTISSPVSGASNTLNLAAATGNGSAIKLNGTNAVQMAAAAPVVKNSNAACTSCIIFDQGNQAASSSSVFLVNNNGAAALDVYSPTGNTGSTVAIGGVAHNTNAYAVGSLLLPNFGSILTAAQCAVTASNTGAATLTGMLGCIVTTGAANTATTFTLTLPSSFSPGTSPLCFEEDGTVTANLTSRCTVSGGTVTVAFFLGSTGTATAPGNGQTFNILLIAGH